MVWNGIPYTYTEFIEIYNTQPNPPVQIVPSATQFCLGQTGQFSSSATADNYYWTISGGLSAIQQNFSGPNFQNLNFTFPEPGLYKVYLQTLNGCCGFSFLDSLQVSVEAPVYPEISIQSSATFTGNVVCEGSQVIFTAAVQNAGNSPSYQWQLNGGNVGANTPTFVLNNPQSGDAVLCIVTSNNGCSTGLNDTSQVISISVISTPVVTCSADSFYTGSPTFFEAQVTSGGLAPFTYVWDFGNNTQGAGGNVATVYTQPGFYNVQVDVTDANGCTGTCNLVVQIFNYLKADFAADKFNGCAPLTVHFTNLSINTLTYLWDFGDGQSSNQTHPSHTYYYPGTYDVTLYAFSAVGNLVQSVPQQVQVLPSPVANFLAYPQNVTAHSDTVYFADNSVDAWSWSWNFGDPASGPLNTSTLQNPVHYYAGNGTYTVTLIVTNHYGCTDTLTKPAFILKNVSLQEMEHAYQISMFPNPVSDALILDIQGPPLEFVLELSDLSGKKVLSFQGKNTGPVVLNVEQLSQGWYNLSIRDTSQSMLWRRPVIVSR
ncbi:MAG: PKD domain-containing protein [Flavobacteriales bacterium]|nr:PKD domain-containing protein [Flavobacteriales bacterium]